MKTRQERRCFCSNHAEKQGNFLLLCFVGIHGRKKYGKILLFVFRWNSCRKNMTKFYFLKTGSQMIDLLIRWHNYLTTGPQQVFLVFFYFLPKGASGPGGNINNLLLFSHQF